LYREGGGPLQIWQVDFVDLHWGVPGGVNVLFGVFAPGRPASGKSRPAWFSHASTSDGKHQFRLFEARGNPVVPANSGPAWDEAIGINVQVWGHLTANVAIRPSGKTWQVVIMGSNTLDVDQIDPLSLRFGPGEALPVDRKIADSNADGQADLVLRFRASDTGVRPTQLTACLTGLRLDRVPFEGCDMLTTPAKR